MEYHIQIHSHLTNLIIYIYINNALESLVRRLRTTAGGKFETLEKYVFEHGEQDATSPEFSAGPLHPKKCISSP